METLTQPSRTPLYDSHVAANGRMVEFAGALLPVQYKSVIAEARAVRERSGMFDVSHMARLRFSGDRVLEYLEWITTNDVQKLADGGGQYSLLPNENGGCVDDIIVYRLSEHEFKMVVNAANHQKDLAHFANENSFGVTIEDYTSETAMLAVQGPDAPKIVAGLCEKPNQLLSLGAFGTLDAAIGGVDCFAARSGYTGEDGYELQCAASDAKQLWDALLQVGVEPCGLGSRDTLRVEAGLPLYGHELSDYRSPIESGLGWVVSKTKKFIGSDHYQRARTEGTKHKLQGILLEGKRLPSPGMKVYAEGEIGEVSSGVFSPLMDCGIAFAFLNSQVKQDDRCEVDIRGTMVPAKVVNKRFFKRS